MTDDLEDYTCGVAVNVHVSVEVPDLVTEVEVTIDDIYDQVSAAAKVKLDELRVIMDNVLLAVPPNLQIYVADAIAKINEIYPLVSDAIDLKLDEIKTSLSQIVVVVTPELATPTHFYPGKTKSYEDTSFVTGESPRTLAVATDLSRNGHDGYITNDGDGNLKVEIEDPEEGFGGAHKLKKDETMDFAMLNIKNIRLTWVANCGYRALVV